MNELMQIREIMRNRGVICSLEQFQSAVNVIFHKYESQVYDELHRDMWESLPKQFELLVADCLLRHPALPNSLRVLDVGCGTGLASDSLLKTELGSRISSIDLLDTSALMLCNASERAKSWNVPVRCLEGVLDAVDLRDHYEVIVTCSVLHHVPDIPGFLGTIRRLQTGGDVFMHLQDPNGDYLADPELNARLVQAQKELPQPASRFHPRRIVGRLYRELTGKQRNDYIARANRELVESGLLKEPLTVSELFSITDIHVHDGKGISVSEFRGLLQDYELIGHRSYGFLGKLVSSLPDDLQKEEERLIATHALNGFQLGAVWQRLRP
jgi:2-polyprenyl-3-methyl-5-hydroxy-6-metoxy-1,4-benzoquinol methylase